MGGNSVGDGILVSPAEWKFDATVAKTFDAHVGKSVPFYDETQKLAVEISDWFVSDNCRILDIGCATGATIEGLLQRHPKKRLQCIGVDNSNAMLVQAQKRLAPIAEVELLSEDIMTCNWGEDINLAYSLYTLQFINAQKRLDLCSRIHRSLSRRGAFVLVEKVLDADPVVADIFTHLHWAKKAEQGFDVTEIYGKAQSLRGVLVPFTIEENFQMLRAAGFSRVSTFFKWCNFCGILAIK